MKFVIAGGTHEAEYIVSMFHKKGNSLVIINPSREEAEILRERENLSVYVGAPWKNNSFEESGAENADIFISLCEKDADNYASCMMAKNAYGAKKCICLVNNPNNVELYRSLGIDSVISSTYLLGDSVKASASVEDIIKAISLENNQVAMIEATLLRRFRITGKRIMDAGFPKYASISCIVRGEEVIIPNGQVVLQAKDKLLMVCSPLDQARLTAFIQTRKSEEEERLEEEALTRLMNQDEPVSPAKETKKTKKSPETGKTQKAPKEATKKKPAPKKKQTSKKGE